MTDVPEDSTELDNEAGSGTVELTLEQQPPKRRIALQFGEQGVEVEGPDELDDLVRNAVTLWQLVTPARMARFGFTAGSTLITDLSGGGEPAGYPDEEDQAGTS